MVLSNRWDDFRKGRKPPPYASKSGLPDRVYDIGNPKMLGTIAKHGGQVSEVLFDSGRRQYVNNDMLRAVRK